MPQEQESFLVSNISPVRLPEREIIVGRFPFESKEQLADLRKTHFGNYLFRRTDQDMIVCVRLDGETPEFGEIESVKLWSELSLSGMLVRHALIDDYKSRGCEITDYRPIEIISGSSKQNLLTMILPENKEAPDWISVRQLCEMDLRVIQGPEGVYLALVINLRIRKRILLSCMELRDVGVDLSRLYVTTAKHSDDPRITARNRTVGRIAAISGDIISLDDARTEITEISLDKAFLRVDPESFHRVLTSYFGKQAHFYADRLDKHINRLSNGKTRLERIQGVLGDVKQRTISILSGSSIALGPLLSEVEPIFPDITKLQEPVFIFDPSGRKSDRSKVRGLDTFGPYTALTFTPNQPRICVVCEADKQGVVEQFIRKFFDGTNTANLRFPPYKKGFCRAYHLNPASTEFFLASGPSASAYRKAAQNALDAVSDGSRWDMALVQVSEATHHLHGDNNPYLVSKAVFHSNQIPVQEFKEETMNMAANNLEYALSNMALASYAKLGGIPWLMKADPTIAHEFVVGIGSSYVGSESGNTKERVVGITTIFSGDGNYFLSNLSRAVPIKEFKGALLEALRSSFDQARTRMNWQKGDHVRLVFHSFKPMKDAEADAVKELAEELTDYSVEFAFLHVVDDHPFLLFDTRQRGERDFKTKELKGDHAPVRGLCQILTKSEALITLTGPKELKKVDDGMPFPVLLRLHRNSTFVDMNYLARQAFQFSGHSWRSFLPASMPVTVVYSQLIARMLGNLALIPRWNPDSVRGRLGRSRWFL